MPDVYARLPDGGDSYIARMPDGGDTYNMLLPCLTCAPSLMPDPNDFTSGVWFPQGTSTVTPDVEVSPGCVQDADLIKVGPDTADELQMILSGVFTPNANLDLKFWCKRVTTIQSFQFENAVNAVDGSFTVDLTALSDDWELLDINHPAVFGNPFKATGGGNLSALFSANGPTGIRQFHAWCMYIAEV